VFAGRVPLAPVLTLGQALDNPYLAATGGVQVVEHPVRPLRVLSNPIRVDGARAAARAAPALGADTETVLAGVMSGAEIAALRARGVVA